MAPSMRIEFQALEGECTVYDNHRVVHARGGFEQRGTSGVRHFRQGLDTEFRWDGDEVVIAT